MQNGIYLNFQIQMCLLYVLTFVIMIICGMLNIITEL